MTLIEGIGDEVTQFFVALFIVVIISLAWWTTSISEQRHVSTVLVLDRRRHRVHTHRRLTNHTESVTIAEGTPPTSPNEDVETLTTQMEPGATSTESSDDVTAATSSADPDNEEAQIIQTMDAENCELRQRGQVDFDIWNINGEVTEGNDVSNLNELDSLLDNSNPTVMEHNYADGNRIEQVQQTNKTESPADSSIRIKLKYINDDLRLVDGKLEEPLGDFKRRHFQMELTSNKIVRLIFNGQVLQPDSQTLERCGLFDNCVVHCLIHQKRTTTDSSQPESGNENNSSSNNNMANNLNNNVQGRDWDFGNSLFAFIGFTLLAAWYFRYMYAHLYTVTATVGLILITVIFTMVFMGTYFPDNENLQNPRIHIHATEHVPPSQ